MLNRLFVIIIPTFIVLSVLISGVILLEPTFEKHQYLPASGGTRALGKEEDESEEGEEGRGDRQARRREPGVREQADIEHGVGAPAFDDGEGTEPRATRSRCLRQR